MPQSCLCHTLILSPLANLSATHFIIAHFIYSLVACYPLMTPERLFQVQQGLMFEVSLEAFGAMLVRLIG